jgi:hypothetical protein
MCKVSCLICQSGAAATNSAWRWITSTTEFVTAIRSLLLLVTLQFFKAHTHLPTLVTHARHDSETLTQVAVWNVFSAFLFLPSQHSFQRCVHILHYMSCQNHLICQFQSKRSVNNSKGKGKAIPLQTLTGPEVSRRLRLTDFNTIGTWRWQGCQPYVPAAFTPRKYSWYSFLLEVESTPGP